jgi:hypothetical protein
VRTACETYTNFVRSSLQRKKQKKGKQVMSKEPAGHNDVMFTVQEALALYKKQEADRFPLVLQHTRFRME